MGERNRVTDTIVRTRGRDAEPGERAMEGRCMSATTKIRNVGPKSSAWLKQVGIRNEDDVKRLGAVTSFLKVKRAGFKPGLNLLYALAGAELECHWAALTAEKKSELILAVDAASDVEKGVKRLIIPAAVTVRGGDPDASDFFALESSDIETTDSSDESEDEKSTDV